MKVKQNKKKSKQSENFPEYWSHQLHTGQEMGVHFDSSDLRDT